MKPLFLLFCISLIVGVRALEWVRSSPISGCTQSTCYFGSSVACTATHCFVGAEYKDGAGYRDGEGVMYRRNSAFSWTNVKSVIPNPYQSNMYFGLSATMTVYNNEDFLFVGSDYGSYGRVYAYRQKTGGTGWGQIFTIDAPADGKANSMHFGWAVSADNGYLVIGASQALMNGKSNSGAAYLYSFDQNSALYKAPPLAGESSNAKFGEYLQYEDPYLVVGVPAMNADTGRVYVYKRTGNEFNEIKRMDGTAAGYKAGMSVSLAYNKAKTKMFIAYGIPEYNSGYGRVKFCVLDVGTDSCSSYPTVDGTSSIVGRNDEYASSIRLTRVEGNSEKYWLAVGAPYQDYLRSDTGTVFMYLYDGSTSSNPSWSLVQTLHASDSDDYEWTPGRFGEQMDFIGDVLVSGLPFVDIPSSSSGVAVIHAYADPPWYDTGDDGMSLVGCAGLGFGIVGGIAIAYFLLWGWRKPKVPSNDAQGVMMQPM